MKTKKNEELQSRREFFKKAAKGALPLLGVIALSSSPLLGISRESRVTMGCDHDCWNYCTGYCKFGCDRECNNRCDGTCKGSCRGTCQGWCTAAAKGRI